MITQEMKNTERESTYAAYWQNNLQIFAEIFSSIKKYILEAENQHRGFEDKFLKLNREFELLSSVYSSFNSAGGREYILRILAVIRNFKNRHRDDPVLFDLLRRLTEKTIELHDESYENFPVLNHYSPPENTIVKPAGSADLNPDDYPLKWLTFERKKSFYLLPYREIEILSPHDIQPELHNGKTEIIPHPGGPSAEYIDLPGIFRNYARPDIIIIADGRFAFPADRILKRIMASQDFISVKIEPFRKKIKSGISTGRVRIFGRQHLYIKLKQQRKRITRTEPEPART